MTTIYRRYVNDPTTSEQELHQRSGQPVERVGEPYRPDECEDFTMQRIRFADGYEDEAFSSELHDLDPKPWALVSSSGIELDRHGTARTASEFSPRPDYSQDREAYR